MQTSQINKGSSENVTGHCYLSIDHFRL